MRIVIPLWTFSKAGGSRVLSRLATEFTKEGHDVLILCCADTSMPYYPTECEIKYVDNNGFFVNREKKSTPSNSLTKIKDIYNRSQSLLQGLNRVSHDYDIVIANYSMTAFSVNKCNIKDKYYYIQAYEAWENGNKNLYRKVLNFFVKKTYSFPLIRIVNADIYKNYKEIKSKYVVPAGLDLNTYYPKKNDKSFTNKEFTIGCIGRKAEWKGSNDVGEAVKILRSKGYKVDFKVAFETIKYEEHELVKPDGDENLSQFYRDLDVLVAPGHIQLGAIHYPVIEAMACKTPVITTGYYPADNDNAYIVPIKRPDKIAETLSHIIDNYDKAIKKAEIAYENIKEFDWQIVSSKFLDIFKNGLRED